MWYWRVNDPDIAQIANAAVFPNKFSSKGEPYTIPISSDDNNDFLFGISPVATDGNQSARAVLVLQALEDPRIK
jgi:hypothetical protein